MWPYFRAHYIAYLVDEINRARLDPITIYETEKIKLMLARDGMEVLEKDNVDGGEEEDDNYRERLIKVGVTAIHNYQQVKIIGTRIRH